MSIGSARPAAAPRSLVPASPADAERPASFVHSAVNIRHVVEAVEARRPSQIPVVGTASR